MKKKRNKQKQVERRIYFTIKYWIIIQFSVFFFFLVKLQHTETDLDAEDLLPESKAQDVQITKPKPILISRNQNKVEPLYVHVYLIYFSFRTEHRDICVFGFSRVRVIISPANKHDHATTHDVEASSLFFDQSRALPRESAPPLFLCLVAAARRHRRGARDLQRATAESVFLWQLPLLELRRASWSSEAGWCHWWW